MFKLKSIMVITVDLPLGVRKLIAGYFSPEIPIRWNEGTWFKSNKKLMSLFQIKTEYRKNVNRIRAVALFRNAGVTRTNRGIYRKQNEITTNTEDLIVILITNQSLFTCYYVCTNSMWRSRYTRDRLMVVGAVREVRVTLEMVRDRGTA